MEWDFTAEEVVRGDADYALDRFREDFMQEVRANMGHLPSEALRDCYDVLYDLSYWIATGRDLDAFLEGIAEQDRNDPARPFLDRAFLEEASDFLAPNIEMLGAVLQRMLMDRVEGAGMTLEQALAVVASEHARVVATTPCGAAAT